MRRGWGAVIKDGEGTESIIVINVLLLIAWVIFNDSGGPLARA